MAGKQEELIGPMTSLEVLPITLAWLLLARGDVEDVARAHMLLSRLLHYVETIHSTRKTIQVLVLQTWAYDLQGRESEALIALEHALVPADSSAPLPISQYFSHCCRNCARFGGINTASTIWRST